MYACNGSPPPVDDLHRRKPNTPSALSDCWNTKGDLQPLDLNPSGLRHQLLPLREDNMYKQLESHPGMSRVTVAVSNDSSCVSDVDIRSTYFNLRVSDGLRLTNHSYGNSIGSSNSISYLNINQITSNDTWIHVY